MDRLHGMKVFEKVADCGSFTAAAEACGMTPQNIAKIIAALEKDIGAQLLNRSTRRQNLTEIGEMYLERARVILADVEETDALVSHFTGEVKGTLRVSVANTFAIYQLSHKLPGWLKENPGIRLDMTVTNREVNLIEEGFDVAVTDEEPPDSSLIRHRISELPIILAASPAYIEANGMPASPEDLSHHTLLVRQDQTSWTFKGPDRSLITIPTSAKYLANNCQISCEMAIGGLGITKQPLFRLRPHIERVELIQVLPDYPIPSKTLSAVYPQRRLMTLKVKKFLDFLDQEFGHGQLM
mgnify:FL=1